MEMEENVPWLKQRWLDFKDFVKRGFPYIVLITGFIFTVMGKTEAINLSGFDNAKLNEYLADIGKVFIGSGLFTFMIKSFQYTGIFKEELTKIIFEPKFLKSRNDLPVYWEKISKELFKNVFPKISDRITKDVKDTYLPTQSIQYYDEFRHTIDIELIDPVLEVVKIKDTVRLILHPKESKKEFKHFFRNRIQCIQNDPNTTVRILSFKVNGEEYYNTRNKKVKFEQFWKDGHLITLYEITLQSGTVYEVEKIIEKTYSLKTDNNIFALNDCMRNNVNVQIFTNGVDVQFYGIGTLKDFDKVLQRHNFIEMHYDGIVYPRQGYLVIMNKTP